MRSVRNFLFVDGSCVLQRREERLWSCVGNFVPGNWFPGSIAQKRCVCHRREERLMGYELSYMAGNWFPANSYKIVRIWKGGLGGNHGGVKAGRCDAAAAQRA